MTEFWHSEHFQARLFSRCSRREGRSNSIARPKGCRVSEALVALRLEAPIDLTKPSPGDIKRPMGNRVACFGTSGDSSFPKRLLRRPQKR